MTSCSINFATKKIYYQAAVSCLALWCAEDSFWTLRRVVAIWHKSMQTATHVLPSVSRENHGTEHVTTCSVWVMLSPSSLSLCGHRTKVWAFRHSVGSRLCCSMFSARPGCHACAAPVPGHGHCWAWQPSRELSAHAGEHCWGTASLEPCQGLAAILAHPGGSSQPQAPHLHACPTSDLVPWAAPPHYAQGSFPCSSLAPGLTPLSLPCPWNPASCLLTTPGSNHPPSPSALPHHNNSASKRARGHSSSVLPCLSYHLSQPKALCCTHTCTTPPTGSPICLSTNCELSPTVLFHYCFVAHKKLNTGTVQTSLICGLFS